MKLATKLLILAGIPLFAFLLQTGRNLTQTLNELEISQTMRKNMEAFRAVSSTVHELQKERGKSLLFLGGGVSFTEVASQQDQTNVQLARLSESVEQSVIPEEVKSRVKNSLDELDVFRKEIQGSVNVLEIRKKYTDLIKSLLSVQNSAANAPTTKGIGKTMTYLTTIESAKEYAGQLRATMANILATDKALTPELRNSLFSLKASIDVYLAQSQLVKRDSAQAIAVLIQGNNFKEIDTVFWRIIERANEGGYQTEPKTFFQTITQVIDELGRIVAAEVVTVSSQVQEIEKEGKASALISMLASFALIAISMLVSWLVGRSIIRPSRNIMFMLTEASKQIASASSQVAGASQSLAQGATEQASALTETNASFKEIAHQTNRNSQTSQSARGISAATLADTESGLQAMQRLAEAMNSIDESAKRTAAIVRSIDEIAFQTNLLALNAAVEAARAGDAGKGFAVVAEEVRSLALRSSDAAHNTAQMIDDSVQRVAAGIAVTNDVAASFDKIGGGTRNVNDLMVDIADSSREQSSGLSEIDKALSEMDQVTQHNAAGAEELSAASEELSAQAGELMGMVGELQLLVDGKSDLIGH